MLNTPGDKKSMSEVGDPTDPPLSFSGELWYFRHLQPDIKAFLVLDTLSLEFKHYHSRLSYLNDSPPDIKYFLSDLRSIKLIKLHNPVMFTIKTPLIYLSYYHDFSDATLEWFNKLSVSLNYYHIAFISSVKNNESEASEDTGNEEVGISEEAFEKIIDLGSGGFGHVIKVCKKDTGEVFAMKRVNKHQLSNKGLIKYVISEYRTLMEVKNPFIIELIWTFQTPSHIHLVLEYCPYGDFEAILEYFKRLEEPVAKFYICEVILAIEYLHLNNIIYRDLKPSNLLLDRTGHIKLSDFNLAKQNTTFDHPATSFCGTPAYLPPEILAKTGAYAKTDIYLIGVNLFKFLTGLTPYTEKIESFNDICKAINSAKLVFPKNIKNEAKNLISQMLKKNPRKRPSIQTVKEHKFFKGIDWDEVYRKVNDPPISIETLTKIINEFSKGAYSPINLNFT